MNTPARDVPGRLPVLLSRYPALVVASALGIALVGLRNVLFGQGAYQFYAWNLFLAWLPLAFAMHATTTAPAPRPGLRVVSAGLWLLFLPNAPYLVTDLVHWIPRRPVPEWFDLLLCVHFAWLGLALGFTSLRRMESEVVRRHGTAWGRTFALACLGLCSFGVYLGRFRRWNSWDLLWSPAALLEDVTRRVLDPWHHRGTWAFTGTCAIFLMSAYWAMAAMHAEPADRPSSGPARGN